MGSVPPTTEFPVPVWFHLSLTAIFMTGCMAAPLGVIIVLFKRSAGLPAVARTTVLWSATIMLGATALSAWSFWTGNGAPFLPAAITVISLKGLQGAYPHREFRIAFAAIFLACIGAAAHFTTPG